MKSFDINAKTTRTCINGRSYFCETDYLLRISRLSVVGRSHPLTAASRANIGVESARVRNVTERQHTTAVYVGADTIPGAASSTRGNANTRPRRPYVRAPTRHNSEGCFCHLDSLVYSRHISDHANY